ncbi:MAG: hypothetical protein SFV54_24435 [Bryobacteraceae bacterium]|nr:hypothetical protein [Bryobacteraceae bacterium]
MKLPVTSLLLVAPLCAQTTIETVTVTEAFGAKHGAQVWELPTTTALPVLNYSNARVLMDGAEVMWQQRSNGRVVVWSSLGRSTVHYEWGTSSRIGTYFTTSDENSQPFLYAGLPLTLKTGTCGPFVAGTTYYIQEDATSRGNWGYRAYRIGTGLGSGLLHNTVDSQVCDVVTIGAGFDGTNNRVIWPNHGLATGDPITLTVHSGTFPAEVTAATKYYAIVDNVNEVGLATSRANALSNTRIDFAASTARANVTADHVFQIQTGAPSTFSRANAVAIDTSNAAYLQIANEHAGVRIHKPGSSFTGVSTSGSGSTRTFTFPQAHGLSVGDAFGLSDCDVEKLNNGYIVASAPTGTTVTAALPSGIPAATANATSCAAQLHTDRMPLRGHRWKNGTWADSTAKLYGISSTDWSGLADMEAAIFSISGGTSNRQAARLGRVAFLESGPLVTSVAFEYDFRKPRYVYASDDLREWTPGGKGYMRMVVTLEHGSQGYRVDTDSNMYFKWYWNLRGSEVFVPNRMLARSGSEQCADGYVAGGGRFTFTADGSSDKLTPSAPILYGTQFRVKTTGTLPGGMNDSTTYRVGAALSDGAFTLLLDSDGSTVNITDAGTGTHTLTRGNCNGTTAAANFTGEDVHPNNNGAYEVMTAFTEVEVGGASVLPTTNEAPAGAAFCTGINYRNLYRRGCLGAAALLYDSAGASTAPVLGLASGRQSKWQGAVDTISFFKNAAGNSSVPPFDGTSLAGAGIAFITKNTSNGALPTQKRWAHSFMVWSGEKQQLPTPTEYQRANLSRSRFKFDEDATAARGQGLSLYASMSSIADPPGGWKPLVFSQAAFDTLVASIRNDATPSPKPGHANFYAWALSNYGSTSMSYDVLKTIRGEMTVDELLRNVSRAPVMYAAYHSEFPMADNAFVLGPEKARALLDNTLKLYVILILDTATAAQKAQAKRLLGLLGTLATSNDFLPLDDDFQDKGNYNQTLEILFARSSVVALLRHAVSQERVSEAIATINANVPAVFMANGTSDGSSNYHTAYMPVVVGAALWTFHHGESELSSATRAALENTHLWLTRWAVPDPRYTSRFRRLFPIGDGANQRTFMPGFLATHLANRGLTTKAQEATWFWKKSGMPISDFYGPSILQYRTDLSETDPAISTKLQGEAYSNLRYGWETIKETSVFAYDGTTGSAGGGHVYATDTSSVQIYALGSYLTMSMPSYGRYPSLYSTLMRSGVEVPELPGGFLHSYSGTDYLWNTSLAGGPSFAEFGAGADRSYDKTLSDSRDFGGFSKSAFTQTRFTNAAGRYTTKRVSLIYANDSFPIIHYQATFSGTDAATPKVIQWNFPQTNGTAITLPSGSSVVPTRKDYPNSGSINIETGDDAPPVSHQHALSAGLNRWQITGMNHGALYDPALNCASNCGIDWDVYAVSSSGDAAILNAFSHFGVNNDHGTSMTIYGIRYRGTGPLQFFWLPRRKGQPPPDSVSEQSCGIQIVRGTSTTCFSTSKMTHTDGSTGVVAAFGAFPVSSAGMSLSGGSGELVRGSDGLITATIGGLTPGERTLQLTGSYSPNMGLVKAGNDWKVYHDGSADAPVTVLFTAAPVTLREVTLRIDAPAGATSAAIAWGTQKAQILAPCSAGSCSVTIQSPIGDHTYSYTFHGARGGGLSSYRVQ